MLFTSNENNTRKESNSRRYRNGAKIRVNYNESKKMKDYSLPREVQKVFPSHLGLKKKHFPLILQVSS
jgi:hypothetical protein